MLRIQQLFIAVCSTMAIILSSAAEEITFNRPEDWTTPGIFVASGDALRIKGVAQLRSKAVIPVDPAKTYRLLGELKAVPGTPPAPVHYGILPLGSDKKQLIIGVPGTDTVLAADAKSGDTVLVIKDGSKWKPSGKETLACNVKPDELEVDDSNIIAISPVKAELTNGIWEITLSRPLDRDLKAGMQLRMQRVVPALYFSVVRSSDKGIVDPGTTSKTMWYPGIKYIQVLVLANWRTLKPDEEVPELEIRNLRLEIK
jgi:hypothetical protein